MAESPSPFHDRRIAGALVIAGLLLWLTGTYLDRVAHGKLVVRPPAAPLLGCGVALDFVEVGAAAWMAAAGPDARGLVLAPAAAKLPRRPNWTVVTTQLEPVAAHDQFTTAGQTPAATLPELLAAHGACRPRFLKIDVPGALAAQLLLDYAAFLRDHPHCYAGGVLFDPGRLAPVGTALTAVRALAAVGYSQTLNRAVMPMQLAWGMGLSYDAGNDGRA